MQSNNGDTTKYEGMVARAGRAGVKEAGVVVDSDPSPELPFSNTEGGLSPSERVDRSLLRCFGTRSCLVVPIHSLPHSSQ